MELYCCPKTIKNTSVNHNVGNAVILTQYCCHKYSHSEILGNHYNYNLAVFQNVLLFEGTNVLGA